MSDLRNPLPSKWRNLVIRALMAATMIGGFSAIVYKGPIGLAILILIIQVQCYREMINISYSVNSIGGLPWIRALSWGFLGCSQFFLTTEALERHIWITLGQQHVLEPFMRYRRLIAFLVYVIGLTGYTLTLRPGCYRPAFSHFALMHCTALLVITQLNFYIRNTFDGIFWFVLPVALVITNDIAAYIFGLFFGKNQLIQVSPKKTWEGFLGAAVATIIAGQFLGFTFSQNSWFICPIENFMKDFITNCTIPSTFRPLDLSNALPSMFSVLPCPAVKVYPVLFHVFVMSIFASFVGPVGGFFASGFKRAYRLKDFGSVLPGHGGFIDRCDCFFMMGTFVNVYLQTFLRNHGSELVNHVKALSTADRAQVVQALKDLLAEIDNSNATLA